jgi:glycosidase
MTLFTFKLSSLKKTISFSFIAPVLFSLSACNTAITPQLTETIIKEKAALLAPYSQRDITDEVFYFVLPDRFYNGNVANDLGASIDDKKRASSRGGFDKTDKGMYHGGDLQGLTEKLPYLDEMGISAIWLTPVLRNQAMQAGTSGYHGYWILDFTEIDPHFGSNVDLKNFIKQAHQRNIKVFFDIITNHTADVIKYQECHGNDGLGWLISSQEQAPNSGCPYKSLAQLAKGDNYTTVIPKGQQTLKAPAWLNEPKYYHNQGDSIWQGESSQNGDFSGLDDIKTEDPRVISGMIEIYKDLINEFKPDGFRIDTVKHVNIEFWQQFAPALVKHAKTQGINNFFMFGEVYSADPKYLSQFTTTGKMQSVLDFGFQQTMVDTLINQQGTDKIAELFAQDNFYNDNDSNANQLINFISNHDMGRFAYMLKQSKFKYTEQEQIARLKLATAMMFFTRGVPVIYYGDEQGFVGDGGDQAARQDMMPSLVSSYNDDDLLATANTTAGNNFDRSHPLYKEFSQYAKIYQQYPLLRTGKQNTVYSQDKAGIFAFEKYANAKNQKNGNMLVVVNTAASEQSFVVYNAYYKKVYGNHININRAIGKAIITMPPLSFAIYQSY